jgi:RNase H-like domain found in reverse transcriptase
MPIAFYSRKMDKHEMNYGIYDQELLAIVECFREWRHYLEGSKHPIVVRTDHDNLRYFETATDLSRRQVRWAQRLSAFWFRIEHLKGLQNPADGPSRRPDYLKEAATEDNSKQLAADELRSMPALGIGDLYSAPALGSLRTVETVHAENDEIQQLVGSNVSNISRVRARQKKHLATGLQEVRTWNEVRVRDS